MLPTSRAVPWSPNVVPTGGVYGSCFERYITGFSTTTLGCSIQPYKDSDIVEDDTERGCRRGSSVR